MTSTPHRQPRLRGRGAGQPQVIEEEGLVERAGGLGEILQPEVRRIGRRFRRHVGAVHGRGMVAAMHIVQPGGIEPDAAAGRRHRAARCVEKGLLMFSPVGYGGASVKIAPPLVTPEEALREGVAVLEEAIAEACHERKPAWTSSIKSLIVGGGMIIHDQILPSLYHLAAVGCVGRDSRSAPRTRSLCGLWPSDPRFAEAFPGQTFRPLPGLDEPPERMFAELYQEAIGRAAAAEPGGGGRARPAPRRGDPRGPGTRPARADGQAAGAEIRPGGRDRGWPAQKGLLVGVEYHKRFDRRALDARRQYRAGRFGQFRCGEAKLVEPYYYRHSNFQNWFTRENSDPFTYIGCHYVDLVYFITGLRPVEVSVRGVEGKFPNGNIGLSLVDRPGGLGERRHPERRATDWDIPTKARARTTRACHVLRGGRLRGDPPPRRPVPRRQPRLRRSPQRRGLPLRQPRLFPPRSLGRRRAEAGGLRL